MMCINQIIIAVQQGDATGLHLNVISDPWKGDASISATQLSVGLTHRWNDFPPICATHPDLLHASVR